MTDDERKAFFEFRDVPPPDDNTFKDAESFFKYLNEKVEVYKSKSKIDDFKTNLIQRGIMIIVDEQHFKIRIEATVMQTKRTLEALVTVLDSPSTPAPPTGGGTTGSPTPSPTPTPVNPNATGTPAPERSTLKITQIRFL